jgi:four helix bundle protein
MVEVDVSMNSAVLQQRTKKFALHLLNLVEHLPDTIGGRIIANQLPPSATSVGANYRALCRGRSRAEFASKPGTVAEESDESLYWLELIRDGKVISNKRISSLCAKADELSAISTSGRRSTSRPERSNNPLSNKAAAPPVRTSNVKPQTS